MTAGLVLAGLNHKTAPVKVREKVAVPGRRLPGTLADLKITFGLDEVVLISTCNRTEIYAVLAQPPAAVAEEAEGQVPPALPGVDLLGRLVATSPGAPEAASGPAGDLAGHLYTLTGLEAAGHLFRVASGLDSLVLGESEIVGQVRAAYEAACGARTAGPVSHALFQSALRAGGRARTETTIGACAVSVPYVALGLARKVFDDLGGKKALLVGAGEIGRVALRHLVDAGLGEIVAANRTAKKADQALAEVGPGPRTRAVALEAVPETLAEVDIVLACTDAPGFVIGPESATRAVAARRGRPLLLIDLGVPRQVDPALAAREGVYLFNLDDLEGVAQANLEERRREAVKVERIVAEEVERFDAWRRRHKAAPVIRRFRERAEEIRDEELRRVLSSLTSLSARDRELVEAFGRRLTNRLLDYPTATLRELSAQPNGTTAVDLFGRALSRGLATRRDKGGGRS